MPRQRAVSCKRLRKRERAALWAIERTACRTMQGFRVSNALLVLVALASVGPAVAQNVLGIDFGSEWIKLAVVQRSAGVQIVLNEVMTPAHARLPEHTAWCAARALCVRCARRCSSPPRALEA